MRGKKLESIVLQKAIRYCNEITQIVINHHSSKADFDNNTEFQFAVGMYPSNR